jgi:hypothetical protein
MASDSGTLDTFGKALDDFNFFQASKVNPFNLKNSCVSVAVAYMEYYSDIEDLWDAILGGRLPDAGLTFDQILLLLGKIGRSFEWKKYEPVMTDAGINTAYKSLVSSFSPPGGHARAIVCYKRSDDGCHCINLDYLDLVNVDTFGNAATRDRSKYTNLPKLIKFLDFQHDDKGKDCLHEIETAKYIIVLYQGTFTGSQDEKKRLGDQLRARVAHSFDPNVEAP